MSDARTTTAPAPSRAGVPTARAIDHVAFTVPDLEQATNWFVEVLGAELVFTAGPFETPPESDWMRTNCGVHPRTKVTIAMLRLGPSMNLELFRYDTPEEHRSRWPGNADVGMAHLCLYVDDLDQAVAYLRDQPGVQIMGEPTHIGGPFGGDAPNAGITWVYFTTPWGMLLELITYPEGMAYEKTTDARLFGPAPAWTTRA